MFFFGLLTGIILTKEEKIIDENGEAKTVDVSSDLGLTSDSNTTKESSNRGKFYFRNFHKI